MRSLPQSKYYFGVVVKIISDELGYTREEVHEICKQMFLSEIIFLKTKKGVRQIRVPKSTTELKTVEFEEYLSSIRQWASMELGIYIPTPNEGVVE